MSKLDRDVATQIVAATRSQHPVGVPDLEFVTQVVRPMIPGRPTATRVLQYARHCMNALDVGHTSEHFA